ncbi:hypothetical protein GCM10019016_009910 [Streptomyces prasinosporus]|uniref:Uncharacterized protein n=1 Tax=Streptomyces prasinosporus TaxID=68256 RepID=A0ABP6TG05_9ACTN|nr:hypothetical protein GCM10010332_69760 [Streptomyces albogriseolus]
MAGLAGPDAEPGGEVGFAGAGRSQKDHVLLSGDEVQRPQMGDDFAFHRPLVVEIEVLQRLAGGESSCPDASLGAMGVTGSDLPLQACGQILLMAPALVASPLGEPGCRIAQGRGLQCLGQIDQFGADVAAGPGLVRAVLRAHYAAPSPVLSPPSITPKIRS